MQFSPPGGNGTVFAPSDVVAERVGFEPTVPLPVHLISSLFCNCDGGARFGVVSGTPVPAETRIKSGFPSPKALQDGLF